MPDILQPDEELERLHSMHDRVEKLRSKLKDLELSTYSVVGTTPEDKAESARLNDGVSKNYPQS